MMKLFALSCITFLLVTHLFTLGLSAQTTIPSPSPVVLTNQKVIYNLPYPGILPDHPLYFLKRIRDVIMVLLTRDPVKAMQLRLLISDKQIAMAQELATKGKQSLAATTFFQAEEQFARVPQLIQQHPNISIPSELKLKIQQSNTKHLDVIENMLKQGLITESQAQPAISKNQENASELKTK